jgi:signal transduction histidine kinase
LGPGLRKTTHTVENTVPDDIALESYPGPLGQIITNLVNNAILHAFEGQEKGMITIHARTLPGQKIELTVRDNGQGIPAANLGRVFDPFFTTKLGKGGSGLGLNIVYNLVSSSLGGKVEVSSVVKQGTCFTFVLPQLAPGSAGGLEAGQEQA